MDDKITSVPGYSVDDLKNWSLLGEFRRVLDTVDPTPPRPRTKGGPERLLTEEDCLCSVLFAMFNPVIDSMRGLGACSRINRIQEEICSRPISLASFSEAQHVFGSSRLEKVFSILADQQPKRRADAARGLLPPPKLNLVDSPVFRAVTRMAWARYRHQYSVTQRAVRLHLQFSLFDGEPSKATITEGRACERSVFSGNIEPGGFYVGDRNYGQDYGMFKQIENAAGHYLIRLCDNAGVTVMGDLPIEREDCAAGVIYDRIVQIGTRKRWRHGPVRVLCIHREGMDEPVILVTNCLDRERFSAALLAELYRQRWQIELFFR